MLNYKLLYHKFLMNSDVKVVAYIMEIVSDIKKCLIIYIRLSVPLYLFI